MRRYRVIVFNTVCPLFGTKVLAKGGGVCFFDADQNHDYQGVASQIARGHLQWDLGHWVEIGIATLDERLLPTHCHEFAPGVFWQGGDEA